MRTADRVDELAAKAQVRSGLSLRSALRYDANLRQLGSYYSCRHSVQSHLILVPAARANVNKEHPDQNKAEKSSPFGATPRTTTSTYNMVITLPSGAAVATAKKAAAKAAAAKKPRAKSNHPRTSDMVDAAIAALKEKGGSSLQAIKKYIAATYKVDAEKLSPFIKKYLKSSVSTKKLVQTKGTGAAGSFKLGGVGEAAAKKRIASPKRKKSPAKKPAGAKPKKSPKKKASPKKKVPKALAAKPPKPKVSKPKPAKKVSTKAKKPALKAKKAKK